MKLLVLSIVGIAIFLFSQGVGAFQIGNASQILTKIETKANFWGLDPALVKAVVKVESNFEPMAENPADPSYGLMQITPMLAQDYGLVKDYRNMSWLEKERLFDVDNNLSVGCSHLSSLMNEYSFNEAIQIYNVGETGYTYYGFRNSDYLSKVRYAYEIYN